MSSLLFQKSSITLLLLSFLSFSTSDLVDFTGNPIINGGDYYIFVENSDSGLTYSQKEDICPLYITYEKKRFSNGIPVKISNSLGTEVVSFNERVSFTFNGPNQCDQSLAWRMTLDPLSYGMYITTGGVEGDRSFSISNELPFGVMYELNYWGSSDERYSVGFYDDGLLGLFQYDEGGFEYHGTLVFFRKATDNLELYTS